MNFKRIPKIFNYFNLINYYKFRLSKLIHFKYLKKKQTLLRNSQYSNHILSRFFKNSLDFTKLKSIFFKEDLFPYSNNSEKEILINILKESCSFSIKNYLSFADDIFNKEFCIFEKKYKFENEINWHYSFFDDYSWPLKKSNEINIRPKNRVVDVKYVWEFNRHQFLMYLGFGYFITKDEKYAIEFKNIILDWINKNPPLYGINWLSGLEISIRLISWIFSLFFFKDSRIFKSDRFFKKIFVSMFQHVYFLKHFHIKRSFNHTVGELFGIYLFSRIFNDFKSIKRWEKKFYKLFKAQISLQTRNDGVNIEQSVNYHRFVLEFFTLFLLINSKKIDYERNVIEKMFEYLLYIIKPNSKFPLIGDIDDGKALLLNYDEGNSYKALLNLGAILFKRQDFKYISNEISISSLLLTGINGYKEFIDLKTKIPTKKIAIFNNSGYYIIRNNWTKEGNYLFVDFGKFGPSNSAHSHSSVTNVVFSYNGKDIITDSGTYTYNKSWKERNYHRCSKAHNILTINHKNQAQISGWFSWKDKPKTKRKVEINGNQINFTCYHDGYKGYIVKRSIICNKSLDNFTIKDFIFPKHNTIKGKIVEVNLYLHLDKDVLFQVKDNSILVNRNLIFLISSQQDFKINIEKAYHSHRYGFKHETSVINIRLKYFLEKNGAIEVKTEIKSLKK